MSPHSCMSVACLQLRGCPSCRGFPGLPGVPSPTKACAVFPSRPPLRCPALPLSNSELSPRASFLPVWVPSWAWRSWVGRPCSGDRQLTLDLSPPRTWASAYRRAQERDLWGAPFAPVTGCSPFWPGSAGTALESCPGGHLSWLPLLPRPLCWSFQFSSSPPRAPPTVCSELRLPVRARLHVGSTDTSNSYLKIAPPSPNLLLPIFPSVRWWHLRVAELGPYSPPPGLADSPTGTVSEIRTPHSSLIPDCSCPTGGVHTASSSPEEPSRDGGRRASSPHIPPAPSGNSWRPSCSVVGPWPQPRGVEATSPESVAKQPDPFARSYCQSPVSGGKLLIGTRVSSGCRFLRSRRHS